jgi:hypothetical protein
VFLMSPLSSDLLATISQLAFQTNTMATIQRIEVAGQQGTVQLPRSGVDAFRLGSPIEGTDQLHIYVSDFPRSSRTVVVRCQSDCTVAPSPTAQLAKTATVPVRAGLATVYTEGTAGQMEVSLLSENGTLLKSATIEITR